MPPLLLAPRNCSRVSRKFLVPGVLERKRVHHYFRSGSGDKLSVTRPRHLIPTYDSIQRLNKRGKQTLTHGHVDSIARSILKQYFGYDDFRHEQVSYLVPLFWCHSCIYLSVPQAAAIRTVLQGENTLVVFPTGAGKSLCYQIPSIAFKELDAAGLTERRRPRTAATGSGITIVVSPLIALMKDQVDSLQRRGIPADCLDSTKTNNEQKSINASIQEDRLRLLYCTPERLNNEGFVESMKRVPGGIRLVAVDEAHCISEWGHSFRPDYLGIARFVSEIEAERVICLTATATPRVAEDVRKAFNIKESNAFKTSLYRPNLELHVEVMKTEREKFNQLIRFIETHDGPTLVYVASRRQAETLAAYLSHQGHSAAFFHAGLSTQRKAQTQEAFMAGSIRIMVATIAFGMGIDKADIRNVLHYTIASTIEEYSQQVGRAGRDGKPSFCMLYLCREDFWLKEYFAWGDVPSRQSLQRLLEDVFLYIPAVRPSGGGSGEIIKLDKLALGNKHDITLQSLDIILAKIELRFGFIRAVTPEFRVYRFQAQPEHSTQVKDDKSPEAQAIASHSKKEGKWYTIDINAVVNDVGLLRVDIIRKLNEFDVNGLIRLETLGMVNRYQVIQKLPSTPKEVGQIAEQLYVEMEDRETDAINRFHALCELLTDSNCFAWALTRHFGMEGGKSRCGHCTYCLTGKPTVLPPKPKPTVSSMRIRSILAACNVRDDPRFLARVAFGIKSPRIEALRLNRSYLFGSLKDHDFKSLLEEFTIACEEERFKSSDDKSS
ncbi:P-loop containing nucleoside triphosphate hydrolase protein [Xylaria sp. FL1042]|nr:P-loop containing nucleoside triphosphate hydrolase protein [Xylaria sp. FL1042]KAI0435448.1 P-loop containing nucleoside triphosphate hydrolase protein [Xylaria sp. FL1042]